MLDSADGEHSSRLFTVKETPGAGRGAFAAQTIPAGTIIHTATDLTVHVLLREYRGEVCWECFTYDRGKKLPVRDTLHGFTFCSDSCAATSAQRYDEVSLQAWAVLEATLRSKTKTEEIQVDDLTKPDAAVVEAAWAIAEKTASSIVEARRNGTGATKAVRRVIQQALSNVPTLILDTLHFQLHAIIVRYQYPEQWTSMLLLESDACPYTSAQELAGHISAFHYLAASLPVELLPFVTTDTLRTVKMREVHNSFGIRSLEDEGSEFFGYGVWPSASYFNHGCEPNVLKQRVGRTWVFKAEREIREGEELNISYLGAPGEEKTLTTRERRNRLEKTWGFVCICERCKRDA
ncbi:Histone-lysine N-methyltransferase set-6 [Gnomoniopsis smithogilvyi]|uniref:Histone-lysine N-methyltransferase set-6 n=1 Tax=Gnomoniopsis smithogilvyi TaxID=1191159 RepID=A0A9W8YJM9_9PEZI|nr:Histone-lysine N-methyltransferase set-6 [Gnomoniopsis smithogilvyi]